MITFHLATIVVKILCQSVIKNKILNINFETSHYWHTLKSPCSTLPAEAICFAYYETMSHILLLASLPLLNMMAQTLHMTTPQSRPFDCVGRSCFIEYHLNNYANSWLCSVLASSDFEGDGG